jgi:hypothetical protein
MIESSRHEEEEVLTTTKMLLANGHRLFRRGLEVMLSSAGEDIEVLGGAGANGSCSLARGAAVDASGELLRLADPAMYQAKPEGKARSYVRTQRLGQALTVSFLSYSLGGYRQR